MASSPLPAEPRSHPEFERILMSYVEVLNLSGFVDPDDVLRDQPELGSALLEDLETYVALHPARDPEATLGGVGDYTFRRRIGRGGMGVVYEAWQGSLERKVALKILPAGIAADDKAFHRFMREAKTAAKLNHPNIVGVYGVGIESSTPYFAMELVEGETLAQLLERPAGPDELVPTYAYRMAEAFAGAAEGIQHAHANGVIHRDLKPSNLILTPQGILRILDFGLARLEGQESLTLSGDVVGTPLYMSPEQARARKVPVDHRTDVYSLGATLYEVLTRRPPFRGRDHQDTLSQIISRDPAPPRKLNPRIPKDLETIVLKCLRKDPRDRYGTAEALAQDLRRFVRGDPVEARPRSRLEKVAHRMAQWKMRIAAGAALTLLIAAAAILVWRERLRADEARYQVLLTRGMERLQLEEFLGGSGPTRVLHRVQTAGFLRGGLRSLPAGNGSGRLEQALAEFEAAVRIFPGRSDARYYVARVIHALGKEPADKVVAPAAWLRLQESAARGEWAATEAAAAGFIDVEGSSGSPYGGVSLEARLLRGIARLERQDFEGAARDFAMASILWPGAMTPALLLGQAYIFAGDADAAERWLEEHYVRTYRRDELAFEVGCMFLNPSLLRNDRARALRWLDRMPPGLVRERARAYVMIWDRSTLEQGIELGEGISRVHEEDALTLAITALGWLQKTGHENKARGLMARAAEIGKGDPYACLLVGDCHFWLGDQRQSETFYRHAIELAPNLYWARVYLVDTLRRQGRYEDAIAAAEECLRRASGDPFLFTTYGLVHAEQKDPEAASRCYGRALDMDPRHLHALYALAHFEAERENYEGSEGYLRRALELEPDQPYALHGLAVLHLRRKEFDEALAAYSATVAIVTIREDITRYVGEVAGLLGYGSQVQRLDCLDSLPERLERVIADDRSPALLQGLALVLLYAPGRKNPKRAAELARRAVEESSGTDAQSFATLATIEHANGHLADAVQALEKAVRLPGAKKVHHEQLERYWQQLSPGKELELVGEGLFPWTTEEDSEWAREELEARDAIRIRCGGDELTDGSGRTWGRDRFHGGGHRFLELEVKDPPAGFDGNIAGTADAEIYRNERWFPADGLYSGYRIPLPRGAYRVTLHFAEIHYKGPGTRAFGVSLEGQSVLEDHEPLRKGFATADVRVFDAQVDDGVLNIDFVWKVGDPKISAIEVARVE